MSSNPENNAGRDYGFERLSDFETYIDSIDEERLAKEAEELSHESNRWLKRLEADLDKESQKKLKTIREKLFTAQANQLNPDNIMWVPKQEGRKTETQTTPKPTTPGKSKKETIQSTVSHESPKPTSSPVDRADEKMFVRDADGVPREIPWAQKSKPKKPWWKFW